MKTANPTPSLLVAMLALIAAPCLGQRIQFPSAIPLNDATATASRPPFTTAVGQRSRRNSGNRASGYGSDGSSQWDNGSSSQYDEDSYAYGNENSYDYQSDDSSSYGTGNSSRYGSQNSSTYRSGNSSGYGSGNSSGYGSGNSSGYGSGNSSGYGSGNSSGYGSGNSSGYGSGNSSGYGSGNSSGYGSGNSSGYGSGNSSGYGSGNSSGYGSGNSSGYGSGNSSGYGSGNSSGYGSGNSSGYGSGNSSGYGSGNSSGYGTGGASGFGRQDSSSYGTGGSPGYGAQDSSAYGTQAPPGYGPQTTPGYGPGVTPGPEATFQGNIQSPSGWDPFATPGASQTGVFPPDPYSAPPGAFPSNTFTTMRRFLDEIRFDYLWMPGTASKEFGINDLGLSATFAIPFLRNPQTPLLVTPGFGIHYWNGPAGWQVDIPPRVYDAYLEAAWNPQASPFLGGELAFRMGVYSDFRKVTGDSLRYQGYGLAVITLPRNFQIKAGIVYLDRQNIKILPAGGVVWTPSSDMRFEILFPNPKVALKLPGYSTCEWWGYLRGEYGGGSWTIKPVNQVNTWALDYNDLRVALGLEFETVRGFSGLFEVGVAFERELFHTTSEKFNLNTTVFIGGGLAY